MSMISSTDPDFRVCRIGFDTLVQIQLDAELQGFATRWSSVEALRGQVKDDAVFLQSLMREKRDGVVRSYRCLVVFSMLDGEDAGGVVTIDIDPVRFQSLERIDQNEGARKVFASLFSLASGGISMVSKE
jgi:hypothetical protein